MKVNTTYDQLTEFKESILWNDFKRELKSWQKGFNQEMYSIVDDAADNNPSTASFLLHMGDLNGRQKAIDYVLMLPDIFLQILEDQRNDPERSPTD